MLTHAIQSDIIMICARVTQRKKNDKKKGFAIIYILRHCLLIYFHVPWLTLETYCRCFFCIINTFVLLRISKLRCWMSYLNTKNYDFIPISYNLRKLVRIMTKLHISGVLCGHMQHNEKRVHIHTTTFAHYTQRTNSGSTSVPLFRKIITALLSSNFWNVWLWLKNLAANLRTRATEILNNFLSNQK